MDRIYFDYNASAPIVDGLFEHLDGVLKAGVGNPSSSHAEGQRARHEIEKSRRTMTQLLDAEGQYGLIFTSGATEGNNQVMQSAWQQRGERTTILLTEVEHSCVHNTALELQKQGAKLVWIKTDRFGTVDLEDYAQKLNSSVALVCVMLVQNETGFVFPVKEMARLARMRDVPFLSDIVCAIGKMPISLNDLGVDFATFSSHKFGGLQGCGGIYFHKQQRLFPMIQGGPQEKNKRAGTENLTGIVSSAFALTRSLTKLDAFQQEAQVRRESLKSGIALIFPAAEFIESPQQVAQTLNVSFPGLNGQVMLSNLDLEGVAVSYGSACASGSLEVSRALLSLGLEPRLAESALRLSFGPDASHAVMESFLERLKRVIERMQHD